MVTDNRNKKIVCRRTGITLFELIVSAVVLMSVMTFVTALCFRVNRVWQEVACNRIAMGELTNQLESLTRMSPEEVRQGIGTLEPSAYCSRTLARPVLEGELIEDGQLGTRVVLRLNWDRQFAGKPFELAGWLVPTGQDPATESDE